MGIRIVLLLFGFLLGACATSNSQINNNDLMEKELGENIQSLESADGKYTLFYSENSVSEADYLTKYMVLENETEKVVKKESLSNSRLSWHSPTELLIEQRIGIVHPEQAPNGIKQYLLNLETGRKKSFPLPEQETHKNQ